VVCGLAAITLLSWIYLIRMAAAMHAAATDKAVHAAMGMPEMAAWGAAEFVMLFLMWAVMMAAMMLPSASPIILIVVGTYRRRGGRGAALHAGLFAAGYVLAWTAFSAVAAFAQLQLHRAAVLSADMASQSAIAGGAILVAVGIYQWLPLKAACLAHCRSPITFLTQSWREGLDGAIAMGARHGLYCVGCCWAVMASLFAAGVMNLLWVGAIAVFVLAEKIAPRALHLDRVAGAVLVVWGGWVMSQARF